MLISDLICEATVALSAGEYADRCVEYTVATWRDFERFCNENNFTTYYSDLKDQYVSQINKREPSFKHETIQRKVSALKKLDTFAAKGSWEKGIVLQKPVLPVEFDEFLAGQDDLLAKKAYSVHTRKTARDFSFAFMLFLLSNGITNLSEINDDHIAKYLLTFKGHARSTLRCELSRFRGFLKHLYLLGIAHQDLSGKVPSYRLGHSASLVKIWNSDEIGKVIEVIDTANPKGKRDHAIIVIASELGMRGSDILNIKLADFDWDVGTLYFAQSKNGKPNALPLNEKMGLAIIDYLRIRPQTDSEYLFVNLSPPYGKMMRFAGAFGRYVHRSGVETSREAHHGMHSLRATVATKLLASNISPDVIFPFLGHADRKSLMHYIRLDIENLRECALSFKDGELV